MGARNRKGIGLSCRPARLHRLAKSIPLDLIPGLLKSLKIPSLNGNCDSALTSDALTQSCGSETKISDPVSVADPA
jgi:hypothetical protein